MKTIIMLVLVFVFVLALLSFAEAGPCSSAKLPSDYPCSVTLNWTQTAPDNEEGYYVEKQTNGGPWTAVIGGTKANVTTYTDASLIQSATDNNYCYRIQAWNTANGKTQTSGYSSVACYKIAAAPIQPPGNPTSLTITFNKASGEIVTDRAMLSFTDTPGTMTINDPAGISIKVNQTR